MKFLLFVSFTCLLALIEAEYSQERLAAAQKECQKVTGVSFSITERGNTNDPKMKEQALCTLKKLGRMAEDGTWIRANIENDFKNSNIPSEKIDKILAQCLVQKSTPADTAITYAICARDILFH